jgi:hypothetical protein
MAHNELTTSPMNSHPIETTSLLHGSRLRGTAIARHERGLGRVSGLAVRSVSTAFRIGEITRLLRTPWCLMLLLSLVAWWSIGAGCVPSGPPTRLDVVFDRTGTMSSNGLLLSILSTNAVDVGDESDDLALHGFISVSLSQLPAGAQVKNAVLHFEASVPLGNPFGDFGTLSVDHVDVVSSIGIDAFEGKDLQSAFVPFPQLPMGGPNQVIELDITDQLKADLAAGRPISSYRFQFGMAPTKDGQTDTVLITAFTDDPANQPYALVTLDN